MTKIKRPLIIALIFLMGVLSGFVLSELLSVDRNSFIDDILISRIENKKNKITDYDRSVIFRMALEQSTAGLFESMPGIADADVNIAIPTDGQLPVCAAIILKLQTGYTLNKKQIEWALKQMCQGFPGLKPDNIIIADNFGNPLWTPHEN